MNVAASEHLSCDLLVIGSGAGGLSAAVTAAWLGLDVIVVEKSEFIGGTTAWSGGWMWVPRNPLAQRANIVERIEAPRNYLRHELGDGYDEALVGAFLEQGPNMVHFFERNTELQFVAGNTIPDFHGHTPDAAEGGRSICAAPYDGSKLGGSLSRLRKPLELIAPFGMGIGSGADLQHFLKSTRNVRSLLHVARRLVRHWLDVVRHGRGLHLVNGNALAARLLKSADDLGVRIFTSSAAESLIVEKGVVRGAAVATVEGAKFAIMASRGVVLAAGGFPHDVARKAMLFDHAPTGREHFSAAVPTDTGDGIRLGEAAGGAFRDDLAHAGAWAPVSLVPNADGSTGHFPHLLERAKPGCIMVRADGCRFANEADSYHDVMNALFHATPRGAAAECWIVCDHMFIRRYGLGRVRPRPFPLRPWLARGYLHRGHTLEALARSCGVDPHGLADTVEQFNRDARQGLDTAFGRGDTPYNRMQGDEDQRPNPCVAPIGRGPFYAIRIVPGSLCTFAGLKTDPSARVLRADDKPVEGLYAVGNDMASVMAGSYPAGGITLGPAMTFGYIAAHHASGVPLDNNQKLNRESEHAL
ncbi:MAG: FAD-dependent oxidoreductase [Pseudolabrys sp.]|jgi:succinate dehydrogenase/fumarate reductase flavoprotein subunit